MPCSVSMLGLALTAAAGLFLVLRPSEIAWWSIDLAGVLSFVLIGAAASLPPGAGSAHPARRFRLHVRLGRWAAALALLHAVAIPIVDSAIWLDATVSMPVYLIAGLVALAAVLATTLVREPIFPIVWFSPTGRHLHRAGAVVSLITAAAHIAFIPGLGVVRIAMVTAAAALAAGVLLWPDIVLAARRVDRRSLMWLATAAGSAILVVLAGSWIGEARMRSLRSAPADHGVFDHTSHKGINCATCHHNFIDKSGMENCLSCHKARSTTEFNRIDRVFHAFCRDCHAARRLAFEASGPIQSCAACHVRVSGVR